MRKRIAHLMLMFCTLLGLLGGCGGHNGSPSPPAETLGNVTFALDWPQRQRSLPVDAESVRIAVSVNSTLLIQREFDRPAAGGRMQVTFTNLPLGVVSYVAKAYPLPGCDGNTLGQVSGFAMVREIGGSTISLDIEASTTVAAVTIDPAGASLTVGKTVAFTASARDTNGKAVFAPLTWASSAPTVAQVDGNGVVSGLKVGSAQITVTEPKSKKSATAKVTVTAAQVMVTVTITPDAPQVTVGNTTTLTATAKDEQGSTVPADFSWISSNSGVAGVAQDGRVTGVSLGEARITATDRASGKSATITVTVTEPAHGGNGKITFYSDQQGNQDIYVVNADGRGQRQLTTGQGNNIDPVFNAGGSKIAFTSDRNGMSDIYIMNADGSGLQRLTDNGANNVEPAFSRDGAQLTYASSIAGNYDVYVLNLASGDSTRLTDDPAEDRHPSFSPDGQQIVFSSDRSGSSNIYRMDADGSGVTQLTDDPYWNGHPVFNPAGTIIAFASNRAGDHTAYQTYLINLDGGNLVRLLDVTHCSRTPCFSPDGAQLAFASNPDRQFDIYIASRDGSGFGVLFGTTGKEMHPSWAP